MSCRSVKLLVILVFFMVLHSVYGMKDKNPTRRKCMDSKCGLLTKISYPFGLSSDHGCGHPAFQVMCGSDNNPQILINNVTYNIRSTPSYEKSKVRISIDAPFLFNCRIPLSNVSLNLTSSPFKHVGDGTLLNLFHGCHGVFHSPSFSSLPFPCQSKPWFLSLENHSSSWKCKWVVSFPLFEGTLPLLFKGEFARALQQRFEVSWDSKEEHFEKCKDCVTRSGVCGFNHTLPAKPFVCYLPINHVLLKPNKAVKSTDPRKVLKTKSYRKHAHSRKVIIGVAAGCFILILIAVLLSYKCQNSTKRLEDSVVNSSIHSSRGLNLSLPYMSYEELERATDYFDVKRELGDGGFGSVFLGKLSSGVLVAVKRLYRDNARRIEQFINEIKILSSLKHPNLVMLIGYCEDRRELLLVYEFASNGTLADHLHGRRSSSRDRLLPWETRLNIAVEAAEGLSYLHFCMEPPVFHRDVKSSNILLDENFRAKIADFGLSRPMSADFEAFSLVSTGPQGTPGYLDPDYHRYFRLSDKSDVYSFGVVLMELISAKMAVDVRRSDKREVGLANMALSRIQSGALHELVDPALNVDWNCDSGVKVMITGVAELAFRCLASEKDDRPNMMEVVTQLKHIKQLGHKNDAITHSVSCHKNDASSYSIAS